jgi:hypothetical protein
MPLSGRNGSSSSVVHSFNLLTNYSHLDQQQCSVFVCLLPMVTALTSLNGSQVNVSERWAVQCISTPL